MFNLANQADLVEIRDELKHFPQDDQIDLQIRAADHVNATCEPPGVIDTHAVLNADEVYIPTLTEPVLKKLVPDYVIEASSATIQE